MVIVVNWFMVIVSLLVCVLFFTMFERKFMSYIQLRKGPKKVGFLGMLTPVADTMKLVIKTSTIVVSGKQLLFFFGPFLSIFMLFILWSVMPFVFFNKIYFFSLVIFFCLSSMNVYSILSSGWGSNSKYSMLGAFRGVAQVMSYEIMLIFVSFFPMCGHGGYKMYSFYESNFFFFFWFSSLFVIWIVSCVAETNRSPFDFAEGESELVSGFNTEYGALEFAFLFLGEYGNMIFISCLSVLIFFDELTGLEYLGLGMVLAVGFIWFRSSFPRFRYDLFMELAWNWGLVYLVFFVFYMVSF